MLRIVFIISTILIGCLTAQAQDSSVKILPQVAITVEPIKTHIIGQPSWEVDSRTQELMASKSLAETLRESGLANIRSYGAYGLGTPAFRGMGASHTQTLWNGATIQSPLSGQLDYSLLPQSCVQQVSVNMGGSASLQGSGAIGGTVKLGNVEHFDQGLVLSSRQEMGSFGKYFHNYEVAWSSPRLSTSTSFFQRSIDNSFSYTNNYVKPTREENRKHAGFSQWGMIHRDAFKLNEHQNLSLRLWYQENDLEIPNVVTNSNPGEATQQDDVMRSQLVWDFFNQKTEVRAMWTGQVYKLRYHDPATGIQSANNFNTSNVQVTVNRKLGYHWRILGGVDQFHEVADVDAFGPEQIQRNRVSMFSSLKNVSWKGRINSSISLRKEIVDGEGLPGAFTLGTNVKLTPMVLIQGNINTSYRIPTFNDLYWLGVGATGNPDLVPESSFGREAGFVISPPKKWSKTEGTVAVNYFSQDVQDWILWRPDNAGTWSPQNVKQVWARGFEGRVTSQRVVKQMKWQVSGTYSFTKTTNQQLADGTSSSELGKQLTYTPLHQGGTLVGVERKRLGVQLMQSYTGKQYTEAENREIFALDSYSLTQLFMTYAWSWSTTHFSLRAGIHNAFDERYENRRAYPMPGRHYSISLKIKFQHLPTDEKI